MAMMNFITVPCWLAGQFPAGDSLSNSRASLVLTTVNVGFDGDGGSERLEARSNLGQLPNF
jgi:hypothetical protein